MGPKKLRQSDQGFRLLRQIPQIWGTIRRLEEALGASAGDSVTSIDSLTVDMSGNLVLSFTTNTGGSSLSVPIVVDDLALEVLTPIDLTAVTPSHGHVAVDETDNTLKIYDGTNWVNILTPVKNSLELDNGEAQLVNDEGAPGENKYYGTNVTGEKGFHEFPKIDACGINEFIHNIKEYYLGIAHEGAGGTNMTISFNGDPVVYDPDGTTYTNSTDQGNGLVSFSTGTNQVFNRLAATTEFLKEVGDYFDIVKPGTGQFDTQHIAITTDKTIAANLNNEEHKLIFTNGAFRLVLPDGTDAFSLPSVINETIRVERTLYGIAVYRDGGLVYSSPEVCNDYTPEPPRDYTGEATGYFRTELHEDGINTSANATGTDIETGIDLNSCPEGDIVFSFADQSTGIVWPSRKFKIKDLVASFNNNSALDGFIDIFDNDWVRMNIVDLSTGTFNFVDQGRDMQYRRTEVFCFLSADPNANNINQSYLFKAYTGAQNNVNQLTETVIQYKTSDAIGYNNSIFAPVANGVQLLTELENVTIHAGAYLEDNNGQRVNAMVAIQIDGVRSTIQAASYIRRISGANEDTPQVTETFPRLLAGTVITASTLRSGVASASTNIIEDAQMLSVLGFVPTMGGVVSGLPAPIITSVSHDVIPADSTNTVRIQGGWFTPDTVISVAQGTVSNIVYIDDDNMEFDLTAPSIAGDDDITVTNENGTNTLQIAFSYVVALGTGAAGTTTQDFGLGLGSWVEAGEVAFTQTSVGTPSGTTGPLGPPAPYIGYRYVETSGSFAGNSDAILVNTDFARATFISFLYHMAGTDPAMGDLFLQYSPDMGNTWISVPVTYPDSVTGNPVTDTIISGTQHVQGDDFSEATADLSLLPVTALRFLYNNFSSFTADMAITGITITSE